MTQQTTPEIILDGVSYNLSNFSPTVQAMVNVRARWEADLAEERSKVLKTESAIRALDAQLTAVVQDELKTKADAAANEVAPGASDPVVAEDTSKAKAVKKVTPLKKPAAKKSK